MKAPEGAIKSVKELKKVVEVDRSKILYIAPITWTDTGMCRYNLDAGAKVLWKKRGKGWYLTNGTRIEDGMICGAGGVWIDTDFKTTKWWWFTNYWQAWAHAQREK